MTDETIKGTKGWLDIYRGGLPIRDIDLEIATLSVGGNTAQVGMGMTGQGETDPAVDIVVDGDESFRGILYNPVVRPSDTWDIDDALTDGIEVKLLKPSGGQRKVATFINGLDGGGACERGDRVYLQDYTPNAIASSNITLGSFMALPSGLDLLDDTTADLTKELVYVGRLAHDLALGNSTSANNGKVAEIWY